MNIDSFLHWLLSASIRASLLGLAVICLQFALQRWLPPRWRYALWLPVVLVLIAPMLPTSPFSVQSYFAPKSLVVETVPQSPEISTLSKETPMAAPVSVAWKPSGQQLLFVLWALGAMSVLAAGAIGYRRNLRQIKRGTVDTNAAILNLVTSLAHQAGLRRVPNLVVSSAVESPAVAGLWRQSILLPANFPAGFTEAESRLVLLHELMHIKRHDLPVNWLLCLLQVLHWFNPLLWLAFSRMRADREAACDAQVLALDSEDQREQYGHALLKLQDMPQHSGLSLAFVGIFERSAGMPSRIRAIASHRRSHPTWAVAVATITLGLTMLGATEAESKDIGKKNPLQILTNYYILELPKDFDFSNSQLVNISQKGILKNDLEVFVQDSESFPALIKSLVEQGGRVIHQPVIYAKDGQQSTIISSWKVKAWNEALLKKGKEPEPISGIDVNITSKVVSEGIEVNPIQIVYTNEELTKIKDKIKDEDGVKINGGKIKKDQTSVLFLANKRLLLTITPKVVEASGKLDGIIIPKIAFQNATIREAFDHIKERAAALDTLEQDPTRKGVNILLKLPPNSPETFTPINLSLYEVPLRAAIDYVARAAGLKIKVESYGVVIVPQSESTGMLINDKSISSDYTKLRLTKFDTQPFRLKFSGTPDRGQSFAITISTTDLGERTQFLKLGDMIQDAPYKVLSYEPKQVIRNEMEVDVSELTIQNIKTGEKIVLVVHKKTDAPI